MENEIKVIEEEVTFAELEEMEDVVNGGTTGFGICCQFVS